MSRISPGTLILGVFAVLFGLVGAYGAKQYLSEKEEEPQQPQRRIVPLASRDLEPGRTIALGDIKLIPMSREEIRRRGLPDEMMSNPQQIIGRTLRDALSEGEPFMITGFYPEGVGPSLAARLRPGHRAVTVPLGEGAAELSLVTPGTFVDVLFRTFPLKEDELPETTVTLLENVEVLAIGEETFKGARLARDANAPRTRPTVTLSATPAQAAALKVVEGRGTMMLVLRNPDDAAGDPAEPKTLETLLGLPRPEKPFTTEIYRGGQRTTVVFQSGRPSVVDDISRHLPVDSPHAAGRNPAVAAHEISLRPTPAAPPAGGTSGHDCPCDAEK